MKGNRSGSELPLMARRATDAVPAAAARGVDQNFWSGPGANPELRFMLA
jgi:hypothetical protein